MKISVIIPCKNEELILPLLLESLAAQTLLPDEIIVVDSNSTDKTVDIAVGLAKKKSINLRVVTATKPGVAHARNAGGAAASGEILFFIDADVILPNNYFKRALNEISARGLKSGGTRQKMNSKSAGIRLGATIMNIYMQAMQHTPWPIAFSCLFSFKFVFDNIGGFDPTLYLMEDYDYILRAKRLHYKVGIISSTFFVASDRRFKDDQQSTIWRGIYGEIYRYTHGLKVSKEIYEYKMGGKKDAS